MQIITKMDYCSVFENQCFQDRKIVESFGIDQIVL